MPAPAYRLSISSELRLALDAFPPHVREEVQSRIDNTLALPVTVTPPNQTTTIEVEGHQVILRLDAPTGRVEVMDVYSPRFGWARPRTA